MWKLEEEEEEEAISSLRDVSSVRASHARRRPSRCLLLPRTPAPRCRARAQRAAARRAPSACRLHRCALIICSGPHLVYCCVDGVQDAVSTSTSICLLPICILISVFGSRHPVCHHEQINARKTALIYIFSVLLLYSTGARLLMAAREERTAATWAFRSRLPTCRRQAACMSDRAASATAAAGGAAAQAGVSCSRLARRLGRNGRRAVGRAAAGGAAASWRAADGAARPAML